MKRSRRALLSLRGIGTTGRSSMAFRRNRQGAGCVCVVSDTYLFWFSFFWPLFPARFRLSHNILASMGRILTHNMLCMDREGRREANGAAVWKIVLRIYIYKYALF